MRKLFHLYPGLKTQARHFKSAIGTVTPVAIPVRPETDVGISLMEGRLPLLRIQAKMYPNF
jgi:hypothetical protein